MATINKASLFDTEIVQTAKTLEALAAANAPFAELEACRIKLSSLIDQKRKLLFSAPDPAYFIDEFLNSAPIEARRAKAGELAELALGAINDILESTEEYDPLDFETYMAMHEFFDAFSRHDEPQDEVDLEPGNATPQLHQPSGNIIRSFEDLSEQSKVYLSSALNGLVKRGFLTPENARYLTNRFADSKKMTGFSRVVNWQLDAQSLATAFVVAYALGEAKLGVKTKRNKAFLSEPEVQPNFASFLMKNFQVLVGGGSKPTFFRISQKVQGYLNLFWDLVENIREELRPSYAPQKTDLKYEDLLLYFFTRIQNAPEKDAVIRNQCPNLCFPVLEAFAEAIQTGR